MDVRHVAKLANLPLTAEEETRFSSQFADTLQMVDLINKLDTSAVAPTSQVTGLVNITRPDVVDTSRVLTQSSALSQSAHHRDGYFVVPAIFHEE